MGRAPAVKHPSDRVQRQPFRSILFLAQLRYNSQEESPAGRKGAFSTGEVVDVLARRLYDTTPKNVHQNLKTLEKEGLLRKRGRSEWSLTDDAADRLLLWHLQKDISDGTGEALPAPTREDVRGMVPFHWLRGFVVGKKDDGSSTELAERMAGDPRVREILDEAGRQLLAVMKEAKPEGAAIPSCYFVLASGYDLAAHVERRRRYFEDDLRPRVGFEP